MPEDVIPDFVRGDARPDRSDGPGEVVAENERKVDLHDAAVVARRQPEVHRIDRGGRDPHLDLPRPGLRNRQLGQDELLGRPVGVGNDGFHDVSPLSGPCGHVKWKRTGRSTC
jgi:hypothetical protein